MSRPRAAAAVCLVVPRNQQVAELFVYTLDVSHYFPRGRYTATFLVSTGIFFSFFLLLFLVYFFLNKFTCGISASRREAELWDEKFS